MNSIANTALATLRRSVAEHPKVLAKPAALPARLDAGAELQISIVASVSELATLQMDWNDLFERAGQPAHVFQTHGFLALFARTHGYAATSREPGLGRRSELAIVTAYRGGRLVLAWPLAIERRFGLRVLSWLGEPVAQYGDVLVDPAEDTLAVLGSAYAHVLATLRPDLIRLRKVRADAVIAPFLASLGIPAQNAVEAPCVTLTAGGSSFEDRQNGKAKKNRRRLYRRLEERGAVTFEEATGNALTGLIEAGLADKRDWLVRRGLLSPALADTRLDAFMAAATAPAGHATGATVFALKHDGRAIAFAFGLRCKQRLMLHLITYASDYEKCGAGVLNLEAILRLAEAEGLEAVDLLPPKADYKLDWADTCVQVGDYAWGTTLCGRLGVMLDTIVKPEAKRALERLPLTARQKLAQRALRSVQSR